MNLIRHGRVRAHVDMNDIALGKPIKMEFEQENGEFITVYVKGMDLLGCFFKMVAVMNHRIDVLQRTLEEVRT